MTKVENVEIGDFLNRIERDTHPFATVWEHFFERVRNNPDRYTLSKIGERQRVRKRGRDVVTKRGKIVKFTDNKDYDLQDPEFKKRFPQLDTEGHAAIVEIVEDSKITPSATKVELKLGRYLIQETD